MKAGTRVGNSRRALLHAVCWPSSSNLNTMIQRVANDHATLLVHNHTTERVAEETVVTALPPSHSHMRAVSEAQHMNSMRSVLSNNHVDAAIERKA